MFKFIVLLCFIAIVSGQDTTTTTTMTPCQAVVVYHDQLAVQVDAINATVQAVWLADAQVQYDQIKNLTNQCIARNINYDACTALLIPLATMAGAQQDAITALCFGKHTILDSIIVGCVAATAPTCMSQMDTFGTTFPGYQTQCMGLIAADKPVFIIQASGNIACYVNLLATPPS